MGKIVEIKKLGKHTLITLFSFIKIKYIPKKKQNRPVLLIIGPVGIGDYMFFRPFFKYIKQSLKFKDYYTVYLGRETYIDFIQNFDGQYFDEIITFNQKTLLKTFISKWLIINRINSLKPDVLYNTTPLYYGRPSSVDALRTFFAKHIKAKTKFISSIGKLSNNTEGSKIYNRIRVSENKEFEMDRVKKEFETLLDMKIPDIDNELNTLLEINDKYIAVSVAATSSNRLLKNHKWVKLINYILDNTNSDVKIVFLGAKNDMPLIKNVMDYIKTPERCINAAGKMIISFVPMFLKKCLFSISVESGNVHIAHAVGCKTLCLAGDFFYPRFHPYKDDIVKYLYPDEFIEKMDTLPNKYIQSQLPPPPEINVNLIKDDTIIKNVDDLLVWAKVKNTNNSVL